MPSWGSGALGRLALVMADQRSDLVVVEDGKERIAGRVGN